MLVKLILRLEHMIAEYENISLETEIPEMDKIVNELKSWTLIFR